MQRDQLVGVWIRQRLQQHAVHHAEYRCVGADSYRDGHQGNCGEPGILAQHSRAVAHIGPKCFQPKAGALFTALFLELLVRAKFDARLPLRFRARRAGSLQIVGAIPYMRTQFFFHLTINASPVKNR